MCMPGHVHTSVNKIIDLIIPLDVSLNLLLLNLPGPVNCNSKNPMITNYLNDLNESQKQAVINTEGPSLVIAGAGAGKTRVLTYRIVHLLNKGVPAAKILALTFTNKAAREMKERITRIVSPEIARYLWMGTFHSVFAKILRMEGERLGYKSNYTIYDSTDSKSLIRSIIRELNLDDNIMKYISYDACLPFFA